MRMWNFWLEIRRARFFIPHLLLRALSVLCGELSADHAAFACRAVRDGIFADPAFVNRLRSQLIARIRRQADAIGVIIQAGVNGENRKRQQIAGANSGEASQRPPKLRRKRGRRARSVPPCGDIAAAAHSRVIVAAPVSAKSVHVFGAVIFA